MTAVLHVLRVPGCHCHNLRQLLVLANPACPGDWPLERVLLIGSPCLTQWIAMSTCTVYQLGPRSWKPDTSLSETVTQLDAERTCKLTHDELPSVDDPDRPLEPASKTDSTSWSPDQVNNSNNGPAAVPSSQSVDSSQDASSVRHSKLTWSASGGIKHIPADDDNDCDDSSE